ncbi:unnamed protein product [Protopolystoma xenopodis]|uniref:Uncharacterized protein n=1 Tax=Protopolystoma xenopodis TaxID=117903 RepID=A0A3S5BAM2_9PLAT|nr:unnamed protein product [Protopolystoma xenopodis]
MFISRSPWYHIRLRLDKSAIIIHKDEGGEEGKQQV